MRGALHVLSIDLLRSLRRLLKSIKRSPLATVWFTLLLLIGEGMVLLGSIYPGEVSTPVKITPGRAVILLSLFFLAKTTFHFRREVTPSGEFQILFTTPGGISYLKWEKLLYILITNLYLYTLFLLPFTLLSLIMGVQFGVDPPGVLLMVFTPLLPTLTGCTMASGRYLLDRRSGAPLYALLSTPLAIYLYLLEWQNPTRALTVLPFLLVLQLLLFRSVFRPWGVERTTRTESRGYPLNPLGFRWEGKGSVPAIAGAYWTIRKRRHDIAGSLVTFAFIASAEVYSALRSPGAALLGGEGSSFALRLAPPAMAAFLIFIASSVEVLLPVMLFFGVDSPRLWLLRTTPVGTEDLLRGKMRSVLLLTPLIIPSAALPMAIVRSFPLLVTVYLILAAVAAIYLSASIGIYAGIKYFEEVREGKGYPPVVPLYSTLVASLAIYSLEVGVGAAIYLKNHTLGILTLLVLCGMNYSFYSFCLKWGAREFEKRDL